MDNISEPEKRRIGNPRNGKSKRFKVGKSYFLGIGINEYQQVPKLRSARKDAEDIAHLLTTRYDVSEENIYTLYDQQASWQGIERCLEMLRDK